MPRADHPPVSRAWRNQHVREERERDLHGQEIDCKPYGDPSGHGHFDASAYPGTHGHSAPLPREPLLAKESPIAQAG